MRPGRLDRRPERRSGWPLAALAPALLAGACGGAPVPTGGSGPAAQAGGDPATGLPTQDHPWTAADYEAAADRLTELAASRPEALPRAESAPSAAYFAGMIDRGPLERLGQGRGPVEVRVQEGSRILHALQAWLSAYLSAGSRLDPPPDVEFVELTAFALEAADGVMGLAGEVLASLPPEEAEAPDRQAGYLRMRGGLERMVSGATSLFLPPDRDGFRPEARGRLARHLARILPPMLAALSPAFQVETRATVSAALAAEADPAVREALEALLAAMPFAPPGWGA